MRGAEVRRFLHGGRRALADRVVRRFWLTLVAFGAAHDAYVYVNVSAYLQPPHQPPAPAPAGPPPAHPERLRADVPLSAQELRLQKELWPARHAGHRRPGAG